MEPGLRKTKGDDLAKDPESLTVEIPPRDTHTPNLDDSISSLSPAATNHKPTLRSSDIQHDFVPVNSQDEISSWSASSDKQLGSPISSDRVFPIRSVVSVDASQTPYVLPGRSSSEQHEYFPIAAVAQSGTGSDVASQGTSRPHHDHNHSISEADGRPTPRPRKPQETPHSFAQQRRDRNSAISANQSGGNRIQLFRDDTSEKSTDTTSRASTTSMGSQSMGSRAAVDEESIAGLVTARFKHIVTVEGHAVITGRDGETLQRCEDEPIHIPGAVQSFGLLIALEEKEDSQLLVRIVSENSDRLIGHTPQDLFKLKSFCDILSEEQQDNLLDHIDFIRDEEADPASNGPEVFTISIKPPRSRRSQKFWCAMHINPSRPDIIICEFELDDDQTHPLVPLNEETMELPEDTLDSTPTEEEYAESTNVFSKPLRVLRSARKRKGEAAAMEVFNVMSQVQEQLASATNLEVFLKILVGVVKELTGFHRVMIYQFDSTFNGRVVTELVDPRATKDLYKGLNFPASDIPKQARDLYKINKVRLLYDRDLETSRLVCRSIEDLDTPLDLSFSYLRAMSPIHIKYLANMAVRSSMSISINAFSELWGLIACHSYGSKGMRVSFPIRKMCRLVGDTASRNIERLSYASRLQARKLINTIPTDTNPSGYIVASSDDLLTLFSADFGLLSIRGETKIMGNLEQSHEALAMLEYLRLRKITSVITSQDITEDFPDLRAGNPYEKFVKEGTEGFLEPRKSFKTWTEVVVGKCREWTEEQVETAAVLCLVYGKFIQVWREKEAALQSSQLTKLLLANSAHEVRTPLNAIINYLEIALEGALDQETRDNLSKSHSASKSLIYVINDLLDLTKTEEGQDLIKDEIFDLQATIREAAESFGGEAKRKGLQFEVNLHPGLPKVVHGDQRRIRQVISNITANALQHTTTGWVHVEAWLQEMSDTKVTIEIVVQDSGAGMSNEKLDALFRDLEQVSLIGEDFMESGDPSQSLTEGKPETRTLGLGLAMVSRIVRNMDGQLRLKSEEGKGSRFVIQLPFCLPDNKVRLTGDDKATYDRLIANSPLVTTPPPHESEGEVTLVDNASSIKADVVSRKRSIDEITSLRSFRSGSSSKSNKSAKSDVDRLIDAISTPLSVGDPEGEERALQRSNSKGSGHNRKSAGSLTNISLSRSSISPDKPAPLKRAISYGAPEHLRSAIEGPVGAEHVTDNKTLLKAIRMPNEWNEAIPEDVSPHVASKVLFEIPDVGKQGESATPKIKPLDAKNLQILVAEDDPINSRIIRKRLEKSGHKVYHTVNGEECASAHGEKPGFFDVILMDMQMPIVDGLTSTKMIRSFEKSHPEANLSSRATGNGRIPIFAVSASLVEHERQNYINAGFDGWILKPIDFKRLSILLSGIVEDETRNSCLYRQGDWEHGGWFQRRQPSVFSAKTLPSGLSPVQNPPGSDQKHPDMDSLHSSESGSITPVNEKAQFIIDERLKPPKEAVDEGHTAATAIHARSVADGASQSPREPSSAS